MTCASALPSTVLAIPRPGAGFVGGSSGVPSRAFHRITMRSKWILGTRAALRAGMLLATIGTMKERT